jgi:hypothetical protein
MTKRKKTRSKLGLGNPLTSLTFTEMVPMARVEALEKKADLTRTDLTTLARAVRDLQTRGDDKTSALSENVRQLGQEMTTAQSDIIKLKDVLSMMSKPIISFGGTAPAPINHNLGFPPRRLGPTTAEEKDTELRRMSDRITEAEKLAANRLTALVASSKLNTERAREIDRLRKERDEAHAVLGRAKVDPGNAAYWKAMATERLTTILSFREKTEQLLRMTDPRDLVGEKVVALAKLLKK